MIDGSGQQKRAKTSEEVDAPAADDDDADPPTPTPSLSPHGKADDLAQSSSCPLHFRDSARKASISSRLSFASARSFADGDENPFSMVQRHMFSQYIVAEASEREFQGEPVRLRLSQIIDSTASQAAMAVVTIISFVDVVADTDARSFGTTLPQWLRVMHHFLFWAFLLELAARLYVERSGVMRNMYTVSDIVVVSSGTLEYLLWLGGISANLASLRILRLSRLLKLSRVVFGVPFFYELRKMIAMIGSCFKTLFWSLLVLAVVLTAWSVVAVEVLNPIVKELTAKGHWEGCPRCGRAFRSVFEANVTFFQTIVAGDSWGKMAIPIIEAHPWTAIIFAGALLTVVFGVLNVVVAVVVDSFAEARAKDIFTRGHELAMEEKREKKALADIFKKIDKNGDGQLDLDELKSGAQRVEMFSHWLRVLDIDGGDLEEMFQMLDRDGSGDVDASEFIEFMYRLKNSEAKTATQFVKQKVKELVEAAESDKASRSPSKNSTRSSGMSKTRTSSGRTIGSSRKSSKASSTTMGSLMQSEETLDSLESVPEVNRIEVADSPPSARPHGRRKSANRTHSRYSTFPFISDLPACDQAEGAVTTGVLPADAQPPKVSELFSATMQSLDAHHEKFLSQVKTVKFDQQFGSSSMPPDTFSAIAEADTSPEMDHATSSNPVHWSGLRDFAEIMVSTRSLPPSFNASKYSKLSKYSKVNVLSDTSTSTTPRNASKDSCFSRGVSERIASKDTSGDGGFSRGANGASVGGLASSIPEAVRPGPFLLQDASVIPPSCHRSPVASADVDLELQ